MSSVSRRGFLQAGATGAAVSHAVSRPNVLFLMTDQLRFDCLGANGNRLIRTPHLDRLAARSARFDNTFVQAPVCVPSRISYFTGRYPHSHKNRVNYTPYQQPEPKIQRLLQQAGYRTGSVGKLHFYPPTAAHARETGFDEVLLDDGVAKTDPYSDYVKWRKAHDPQAAIPYHKTVGKVPAGKNPFRCVIGKEYTPTAWTGQETCRVLRDFAASPEPFFLFSSFFKPHSPHTVPAPYDSMYDHLEIPLPRQVDLAYIESLPLPVQKMILRAPPVYGLDRERLQWTYRSYYAGVSMIDDEVGRILDELDRSGKADNTLIVFASDHGDQLLEHGLFGKNVFFESSVHIPLMVSYPGRVRTERFAELIETVDVMPAILEFCGLPVPENLQGKSFAPLIAASGGGTYRAREFCFAENVMPEVITNGDKGYFFVPGQGVGGVRHPDAKMLRTPRWKLNYYPGQGGELYDLENDPAEFHNLYRDAASQKLVQDLKGQLLDWLIVADENDQIARRWLV